MNGGFRNSVCVGAYTNSVIYGCGKGGGGGGLMSGTCPTIPQTTVVRTDHLEQL